MQVNGTDNGIATGTGSGDAAEVADAIAGEQHTSAFNRAELMEKTGAELAQLAAPYSDKKLSTLERMSKAKLCDIIMKGGEEKGDDAPKARAARTESETEQIINMGLTVLEAFKQNRDGKPLNPLAREMFQKQAIIALDEQVQQDRVNLNTASKVMLFGAGAVVVIDGIFGLENSPALLSKLKNKLFSRKKEAEK
ncbi:hypothetical protein WCX49_06660 [Sulfurimonas sp. HSL-1656]|uniref:hypothetical protein n=1 Tax=Thiomicrolovo subterrani TaxID=3131934 RepID=UPI0031FA0BBD